MSLESSNFTPTVETSEISKGCTYTSSFESSYTSSSLSSSSFASSCDNEEKASSSEDSSSEVSQKSRPGPQASLLDHERDSPQVDDTNTIRKLRSRARTVNHIWVNEFDLEFCSDGEISDASVIWSDYGDEVILDDDELTQYMNPFQFQLSKKLTYSEMKYSRSNFPRLPNYLRGKGRRKGGERNKKKSRKLRERLRSLGSSTVGVDEELFDWFEFSPIFREALDEGKKDLLKANPTESSSSMKGSPRSLERKMKKTRSRGKILSKDKKSDKQKDSTPLSKGGEGKEVPKARKKSFQGVSKHSSTKQKIENWDNLSGFWRMVLSESKMIITPMNYSRQLDHEFRQKKEIVSIEDYEAAREKCSQWIDKYSDFFSV